MAKIDDAVKTIDASGLSGGLTARLPNRSDIRVKGGQGNDKFTTGYAITGTAYVDAGAGTGDTHVVANSSHITSNSGRVYKGFEVLQGEDGVEVNLDHLSAYNSIGAVIIEHGYKNIEAEEIKLIAVFEGVTDGAFVSTNFQIA